MPKRFKVRKPNGVFIPGDWGSKEEIPTRLPDRREQYFNLDECEIVEVETSPAHDLAIRLANEFGQRGQYER